MHHRRFMSGENRHGRTLGHRTRVAVHREAARHSPGNRRQAMQPVIAKPGSEHVGRRLGQAGRRRPSIARLPRCVRRPKLSCRLAASRAAIAQAKRTERAKRAKQATSAARSAQATQPMQPICTAHSTIGLRPAACGLPPIAYRLSHATIRDPRSTIHDQRSAISDQRPATCDLRPAHPRTRAPAHPRSCHAISAARNPARSVCPLSFGSSFAPVIQRRQFGAPQWHSNWRISTSSVDA